MQILKAVLSWCKENPSLSWPIISALIVLVLKPRSPAQYAAMIARRPTWFFSRLAPMLQLIGSLGLDLVKAMQVAKKVVTGKEDAAIKLVILGVLVFSVQACVTPKQAGDGAKAACTLVEVFTDSAVVDSICATAPELIELGAIVMMARPDAEARKTLKCSVIPTTQVCAESSELIFAIRKVKAKR